MQLETESSVTLTDSEEERSISSKQHLLSRICFASSLLLIISLYFTGFLSSLMLVSMAYTFLWMKATSA